MGEEKTIKLVEGKMKNNSVVWVGPKKLEVQQREVKEVGEWDVLVEVVSTGICGSDGMCFFFSSSVGILEFWGVLEREVGRKEQEGIGNRGDELVVELGEEWIEEKQGGKGKGKADEK